MTEDIKTPTFDVPKNRFRMSGDGLSGTGVEVISFHEGRKPQCLSIRGNELVALVYKGQGTVIRVMRSIRPHCHIGVVVEFIRLKGTRHIDLEIGDQVQFADADVDCIFESEPVVGGDAKPQQ